MVARRELLLCILLKKESFHLSESIKIPFPDLIKKYFNFQKKLRDKKFFNT